MRVCDKCGAKKPKDISYLFADVEPFPKTKERSIIKGRVELCEDCLTKLLEEFGRFLKRFTDAPS